MKNLVRVSLGLLLAASFLFTSCDSSDETYQEIYENTVKYGDPGDNDGGGGGVSDPGDNDGAGGGGVSDPGDNDGAGGGGVADLGDNDGAGGAG